MASTTSAVSSPPGQTDQGRMSFWLPITGLCCWLAFGGVLVWLQATNVRDATLRLEQTAGAQLAALAAAIPHHTPPGKADQDDALAEKIPAVMSAVTSHGLDFRVALLRPDGAIRIIPASGRNASLLTDDVMHSLLAPPPAAAPAAGQACTTLTSAQQPLPGVPLVICRQPLPRMGADLLIMELFTPPYALSAEAQKRHTATLLGWAMLGVFLTASFVLAFRFRATLLAFQKSCDRQISEEIKRSREHAAIYNAMQQGAVILKNMRVAHCNPSFAYCIGLEPDMAMGMHYTGFIHPQDAHVLEQALRTLWEGTQNLPRFSLRLATGLGDLRWVACTITRARWQNENAALLCVLDMTPLKKAEHEKEFAKAEVRALLANAPLGFAVFDAFGSLVHANSSWTEMWGDPTGGGMRRVTAVEEHASFPEAVARALHKAFDGVQGVLPHLEHRSPWGETVWLSVSLVPLQDLNEKVIGVLMLQEDISKSVRQAHNELELTSQVTQGKYELLRLRDHIAAVMDATPSVLIGVDEERRITLWNSMAETRFGLSRQKTVGLSFGTVDRTLARHEPIVHKALRERAFLQISMVPHVENGVTRYEDISVYPIETNLETGAIIRIDDVTKRMRMEESLAQVDRLSSVGMLAAGMAHEINNPLSAILQGVQNLERRLLQDMPANRDTAETHGAPFSMLQSYMQERHIPHLLESIQSSGQHIGGIVSNMLRFSRKHDPARVPADVNVLVEKALEFAESDQDIQRLGDFSGITLLRDLTPGLPKVMCSESDIVQVLLQLLRTSVHSLHARSSDKKPSIRLQTRREKTSVSISITDNGPGMPPEVCRRIFEPFYTTHDLGQGGLNIGLSLTFFIITTVHKGTLHCESSLEHGTTFTVRLPIAGPEEASE